MNIFTLCILIFIVRIVDTSLDTIRTILLLKNKRLIATIIAFIEILIWFLIVKEAINTPQNSIFLAISYASGFAVGTYVGMSIIDNFLTANVLMTVVINKNNKKIMQTFVDNNIAFSATKVKGKDFISNKEMLYIVTINKNINKIKEIILNYDSKAFIVVNEPKSVYNGHY